MPNVAAKDLVGSYQTVFRDALTSLDPAALMRLRGELQIVSRWLDVQKMPDRQRDADAALEAVSNFYQFSIEIGGFSRSTKTAETASLYDLASVGVLAIENVLTAEKPSLIRFLMSGLSEGLMFVGSRQYVAGTEAVLQSIYRSHALAVQDSLWSLAADFRDPETLDSIREVRAAIGTLFEKIDQPSVPLGTKLSLLHQLYGLVAVIRCATLVDDLRRLP